MRVLSIVAAVALLALTALNLVPALNAFHTYLSVAAVAVAGVLLLSLLASWGDKAEAKPPIAAAAKPPVMAAPANQVDAEVVSFLATLQERGRLVDFLMEDITAYTDAQVGAAARVVHGGCKAALTEHFRIRPIRDESEGTRIDVPAGYAADEYRMIGKIGGSAPFSGTLVHRGWKTEWVKLPRLMRDEHDRLPTIAPAEVELG